jgi:hypothetical protein
MVTNAFGKWEKGLKKVSFWNFSWNSHFQNFAILIKNLLINQPKLQCPTSFLVIKKVFSTSFCVVFNALFSQDLIEWEDGNSFLELIGRHKICSEQAPRSKVQNENQQTCYCFHLILFFLFFIQHWMKVAEAEVSHFRFFYSYFLQNHHFKCTKEKFIRQSQHEKTFAQIWITFLL